MILTIVKMSNDTNSNETHEDEHEHNVLFGDHDRGTLDDSSDESDPDVEFFENTEANNIQMPILAQTESQSENDLKVQLANWALQHNITHSALSDLLGILKPINKFLPVDARTLLKTPRINELLRVEPGQYHHFGFANCLETLLQVSKCLVFESNLVEVNINIDGLPLSKSSGSQFYPILCNLHENKNIVCAVGIYHGSEKPVDANEFLKYFVDEASTILNNGFMFEGMVTAIRCMSYFVKFSGETKNGNGNSSAPNSQQEKNPSCTCCQFHMNELQITLKNLITEIENITKNHNLMMSVITESIDEVKNLSIQLKKRNREDIQPDSPMSSHFNFPISSQENFSELEEYLSNEKQFNSAVIEISKMGGANEYDFIKRSLSWMMKNSLLMQFTWHGTKEKKGLMSTKFGQTILKASERISAYTSMKNVEVAIKKFLRRAKERNAYENKSEPNTE